MATATSPIATIQTRIAAMNTAYSQAQSAYTATKAAIQKDLAAHASAHQVVVDAHAAEVKAANDLSGSLGETAAIVDETPQIVLTAATNLWGKVKTWWSAHWRWVVIPPAGLVAAHYVVTSGLVSKLF